ncbi:hypothetical protein BHM03_00063110 [Ensete ventricosum]|nr:hypothetical protein BHM03_00063110 [Ensete ventricosum]
MAVGTSSGSCRVLRMAWADQHGLVSRNDAPRILGRLRIIGCRLVRSRMVQTQFAALYEYEVSCHRVAPEYALSFFPPPPQEACLGFLKERLKAWLGSFASWVCDPVGCVGSPAVIPIRARWPASILLVYRCEPLVRLGFVVWRRSIEMHNLGAGLA